MSFAASSWLWAQAQPEQPGFTMLVPMIAIFGIFYFLLIRPQQKKQREMEAMIKAIEKGDSVVTSGGLHGKVTGVSDDVLTLEVGVVKGDHVRVRVARNRIEAVEKDKNKDAKKKGNDS